MMAGERRIHAYLTPDALAALEARVGTWPARKLGVFSANHCTYCTAVHEVFRYEGSGQESHRWAPVGFTTHLGYPLPVPAPIFNGDLRALEAWRREHSPAKIAEVVDTVVRVAGL